MQLARIAIKNPQFTIMIFILLFALGVASFITMPRYENPQLDIPGLNIILVYSGASAEDIEEIIVNPLEDDLYEIDNIRKMTTSIRDGFATIRMEFELTEDKIQKVNEVTQKINALESEFPEGVTTDIREFSISAVKILQLALTSDHAGYFRMQKVAEELKDKVELLYGVKEVEIEAYPERQVSIDLNFDKLAYYKISPRQVVQTIQSNNANIPAGTVQIGDKAFNLQTSGAYKSIKAIENTIIKSIDKQPILIKDVAKVYFEYEKSSYIARANRKRAIFVNISPKENANVLTTIKKIKKELKVFESELPADMDLSIVFDQSKSINTKVNLLFNNLWQGIVVVGFFILLFFNLRASALVMIAIPLSFLIALIGADYSSFGLQFMSIAGLIIALGLLVDNAIVIVENVYHFIKEGYSRQEAAIKAVDQVGWAIVSSTATTVIAFMPLLTIKSLAGEYMRSMPLTLIYTLLASLFVALTFTPFLSSRVLQPNEKQKESALQKAIQGFIDNIYQKYILNYALNNRIVILATSILIFLGASSLYFVIGLSFFPRDDVPIFAVNIITPQGTVLEKTDKSLAFVEDILEKEKKYIEGFASNVGKGNPRIINVLLPTKNLTSEGQIIVYLKDDVSFSERDALYERLRQEFNQYSKANIEVKEIFLGPPLDAQIAVKLYGKDISILKKIAKDVENIIAETPNTVNIYNPLKNFKTDLKLNINYLAAADLAIPISEIDQNVRIAVSGTEAGEFTTQNQDKFPIYVKMETQNPSIRPSELQKIYVSSAKGLEVPISQVANLEFTNSPERINHDMTRRTFTLQSDVLTGKSVDLTTKNIIDKLEKYKFPKGYSYSMGGEIESRTEAFGDLFKSLIVALLGIFSVLVLQFRSFVQPLIIFTAIPLSLIGAFLGLFLAGYSFSFTAFLGLISLVGIVVNDSIILIDLTNQYLQEGMPKAQAIRQASSHRFVPILLTSLTTIGGLLPLTLQGGLFWAPMGWCIIGGLATSTFLILIVVPVLYDMLTFERKENQ